MPLIKPFSALIPAPHLQSAVVVLPLENYSTGEAKLIAAENNHSFIHLINPVLDYPYLRGNHKALIFKRITEKLADFLNSNVLVPVPVPSFYIYQVKCNGKLQHGLWTLSHASSYLDGNIKKHEHTVEKIEKELHEYLYHTGVDANPVLITYHPSDVINKMIEKYMVQEPILDFKFSDLTLHRVWAVSDPADISAITAEFAAMDRVYIADGHHRAAAMSKMECFSTVYMNTEEIRILPYNRLVRGLNGLTADEYLFVLEADFKIEKCDSPVEPAALHQIGMYLDSQWYIISPKPEIYKEEDPVGSLDVSILQSFILEPLLAIKDPRKDARINFEAGSVPAAELQEKVDNGLYSIAFTLFAVSVNQLIKVADNNEIMPPKSTWIEPKFLIGILTNKLN